jgi:hypothetical protein
MPACDRLFIFLLCGIINQKMGDKVNEENKKFNKEYFLIKITSRKFWVWIASLAILLFILIFNRGFPFFLSAIIFCGVVSLIYLIGEPIETGIGKMIGNVQTTLEAKFGAQFNAIADAAKAIEAVKDKK